MDAERIAEEAWHCLEPSDVLDKFGGRAAGLSDGEVARRRRRFGENSLLIAPPTPWWEILARQFRSMIVALLTAAAIGAWLMGDRIEASAIVAVLVLNTGLGFAMEMWARQVMGALQRLEVQRAVVRREGRVGSIDSRELVPGDIILVEAGEAIPADSRILSATELRTIEAPLTGESTTVAKSSERLTPGEDDIPLAERQSMIFKGTLVATGSAEAVVTATGADTEIGRIAELVVETSPTRSPLERQLDVLGRRLVWVALAVAALIASLGILRGNAWWLMIETGLALAIAAIPEGLPVVATITLAVGMRRMARRQALVRRLSAVETLGAATVVCTDKTGTLTACQMTVVAYHLFGRTVEVTGAGYVPEGRFLLSGTALEPNREPDLELALRIGLLTNRAGLQKVGDEIVVRGDPTEAALIVAAQKAGIEGDELRRQLPEIGQVPFSSERMLMATFHRAEDGRRVAFVKGAPDRVVEAARRVLTPDGPIALDAAGRSDILEANRQLAGRGLRVLALACRDLGAHEEPTPMALTDLTLVGLVGITDPPAPHVEETVRGLAGAGVRTVMITGDQAMTTLAVGRELGLVDSAEEVFEGGSLQSESDEALGRQLERVGAFSRVSPADKLRIVEAFQERGEIVAMLGDGVNDAPALKRADIGVAMGGRGTDVAKETAALVLRDDRFETLFVAVREGRVIFDNIRKFVFYLFSCNLAEVMVLFVAGLGGMPMPLLPLQILWLNLVTDVFPALALAAEPAEPGVMRRPPRDPRTAILSRGFLRLTGFYAAVLTAATLATFLWSLEVRHSEPERAVTVAFMTLALSQLFHVFNARSERAVLFGRRLWSNGWVWASVVLTVVLQLLAVYQPRLVAALGTTPLVVEDWTLILLGSIAPLLVGQISKTMRPSRRPAGAV